MSLNIPDFSLFFVEKIATPPEKSHPLFPSNPPLQMEALSSPPLFWKFGRRLNPLPPSRPQQKGGRCTLYKLSPKSDLCFLKINIDLNILWSKRTYKCQHYLQHFWLCPYSWPNKLYQFITNLFFLINISTSSWV